MLWTDGPTQARFLALAAAYFHVETDHAILVANGYDRNILRDVVFRANDLLRRLRHAGRISKRKVVPNLLFDRHRRPRLCRRRFRCQSLWIVLDSAVAEQPLRAIIRRRI